MVDSTARCGSLHVGSVSYTEQAPERLGVHASSRGRAQDVGREHHRAELTSARPESLVDFVLVQLVREHTRYLYRERERRVNREDIYNDQLVLEWRPGDKERVLRMLTTADHATARLKPAEGHVRSHAGEEVVERVVADAAKLLSNLGRRELLPVRVLRPLVDPKLGPGGIAVEQLQLVEHLVDRSNVRVGLVDECPLREIEGDEQLVDSPRRDAILREEDLSLRR